MLFLHCFTRSLAVDNRALPRPVPRRAQTTKDHHLHPEQVHSEPYRKLVRDDSVPWRSQRRTTTTDAIPSPSPVQAPVLTPISGIQPRVHHNANVTVRGPSEPSSMPSLSCTHSYIDSSHGEDLRKSSPHLIRSVEKHRKSSSGRLRARGWNIRRALDISGVWRRFTAYRQQRSGGNGPNAGDGAGAGTSEKPNGDRSDKSVMETKAEAESHVPMQPANTELMPTPTITRLPASHVSVVQSSAVILITDSFTTTAVSDCESGAVGVGLAAPRTDSDLSSSCGNSDDGNVDASCGIAVEVRSDAYIDDIDSEDGSECASEANSTEVTMCVSARALDAIDHPSDCDADAGPADTTPIRLTRAGAGVRRVRRHATPASVRMRRKDRTERCVGACADFDAWCDAESVVNSVHSVHSILTDNDDSVFTPECVVVQRVDSFQLDSENEREPTSFVSPAAAPTPSKPYTIFHSTSRPGSLPRRPSAPLPPHLRTCEQPPIVKS